MVNIEDVKKFISKINPFVEKSLKLLPNYQNYKKIKDFKMHWENWEL
jgi:hypothetical protein